MQRAQISVKSGGVRGSGTFHDVAAPGDTAEISQTAAEDLPVAHFVSVRKASCAHETPRKLHSPTLSVVTASIVIAPMTNAHADDVLRIYQHGIDEGNATFETAAPAWEVFDAGKLPEHRFVALDAEASTGPAVLGYVAVSAVSKRACYAGVVELSVYVDPAVRGRGVGNRLLGTLIASTEAAGVWTINAGIFPENTASLALHERHGFRVLGRQERIGKTVGGVWRDVVLLERRSKLVD